MAAFETPADMLAEEAVEGFSSATAKRAARNATALALSNIASKGLLFIWQLMLARWLESSDYGVYGTIGALLRAAHPLLAAVGGVPVYLIAVLAVGVIGKDDWDLIYRLTIAMPGGTVIAHYWKRQLA